MNHKIHTPSHFLLLVGAISLALFGSCVSSGGSAPDSRAPAWYSNTGKVYPNSDYLAVQGFGSTERDAKHNAAGELATLFSAKVQSDSTASFRYSDSDDNASRSVQQTVNIRSNQEIAGLEYSEPFRAGGRVYIVAYLDRDKVGKLYAERIEERRNKIAKLSRRAQNLDPSTDATENLLAGFILYDYSVDLALRNQILLEQLQIINKPMHENVARKINYNSVKLAEERSKFASRISFAVNYSGEVDLNFLGENIASQMTKLGFVRRPTSAGNSLAFDVDLKLADVQTNNDYANLAWDLQISFTRYQNADGSGNPTTLLEFSKSGRESGISRSRTTTTLKRLLNEQIQREFMSNVYAYFAKFAGI